MKTRGVEGYLKPHIGMEQQRNAAVWRNVFTDTFCKILLILRRCSFRLIIKGSMSFQK